MRLFHVATGDELNQPQKEDEPNGSLYRLGRRYTLRIIALVYASGNTEIDQNRPNEHNAFYSSRYKRDKTIQVITKD